MTLLSNLSIRSRLALLSGFLLAALVITNIYVGDQVVASKHVLLDQKRAQESVASAHAALRDLGELKYWLADLKVSWLIESEELAEQARSNLRGQLEVLASFAPDEVSEIEGHVDAFVETSMKAVDAYIDGNRVLGNSLTAKTRAGKREADAILLGIASRVSGQAARSQEQAISDTDRTLTVTTVVVIAAVFLAVALTLLVMHSIIPALRQIVEVMNKVTGGHPYVEVPGCGRKDEIGAIARAVENAKQNLIKIKGMQATKTGYDGRYR